ncbi:M56 family metallopeptidase [Taibaiella soli]|uniref:Peptidase M56 domain-containing protein n=1 Tax=Taibaiella soli TaxID=1649169 RepID=A0A2W2AKY6_9BACT|nr:M56 family metallopeptidase [Taibaiella soli]PZF74242.1 hypothetical protein DN068_04300 [Taibaiella soli]
MLPGASIFIHSLGWTIVHSLWQGALVAASLGIIFKLAPRLSSRIKYHLSVASFFFLFGWVITTGIIQWQRLNTSPVVVTEKTGQNVVKTYVISNASSETYTEHLLRPLMPTLEPTFSWLVALYFLGLLIMTVRLVRSITDTFRTKRFNEVPDDKWYQTLEMLKQRMGIDSEVWLRISRSITVPIVMGFIKPLIILPVAVLNQLSEDQLEAILLHELAHIKRQDYLVNMLQNIIETVLFFNPFVWHISSQIRREREHCCDDLVISCTENPFTYATALAALEKQRVQAPDLALAASGKKQYLFQRIKRIMEMEKQPFSNSKAASLVLIICGLGLIALLFTPSFAQNLKNTKDKDKDKTTVWISDERLRVKDAKGNEKVYNTLEEWPAAEKVKMAKEYSDKGMNLYFGPKNRQLVLTDDGNDTRIIAATHPIAPTPPLASRAPLAPPAPVPAPACATAPLPPIAPYGSAIPAPVAAPMVPMAPMPPMHAVIEEDGDNDSDFNVMTIVNNSLQQVNWDTINATVNNAMTSVDWKEIQKNIDKGMKDAQREINDPKVKAQIRASIRESKRAVEEAMRTSNEEVRRAMQESRQAVNDAMRTSNDEMRRSMEESRRVMQESREQQRQASAQTRIQNQAMEESRRAMQESREQQQQASAQARIQYQASAEDAKKNHTNFNRMLSDMESQKLIDRNDKYKIEKKDGHLYINGEEQPQSIYNQYREYLNGDEIKIKGNKSNLSISVTNND